MLDLVATCGLGLEELLEGELAAMGARDAARMPGGVAFRGGWADCWRANWRLRTANRVLVEIASWDAPDGDALAAGARAVTVEAGEACHDAPADRAGLAALLHPSRSIAVRASATASRIRDPQWAALKVKDGLVDGQRQLWGRRSDVERERPDLPLRLRLHRDRATLLLDTSGEPLDRRGYRAVSTAAPLRETLAAACVLAAGWDGSGPVVDPMCGSGTLLAEAGWMALGRPPGALRAAAGGGWAFQRLPGFDPEAFAAIQREPLPAPGEDTLRLLGRDHAAEAVEATRANLARAGLAERANIVRGEAFAIEPPAAPGLLVVNPPYGERLADDGEPWRRLGDLLKRRFAGWTAVVLAGGAGLGKGIALKPRRRLPVWNGPLEARILVFDLY